MKPLSKQERLDVDIRFLLANERTLLAWVRTGVALQAGGLALNHFGSSQNGWVGVVIILLGTITAGIGYIRFRAADRAIRCGQLPTPGYGPTLEVGSVMAVGLVILLAYR
jgi:putative membrane protein